MFKRLEAAHLYDQGAFIPCQLVLVQAVFAVYSHVLYLLCRDGYYDEAVLWLTLLPDQAGQ